MNLPVDIKPLKRHEMRSDAQSSKVFIYTYFPFIPRRIPSIQTLIGRKTPFVRLHAFTLVELMAVLAIVSILTLLAAPAMNTFIESNRLTTLTNELIADISFSRSTAITRSMQVGLCASAGGGTSCGASTNWGASGWLSFIDADGSGTWSAGDTVIRTHPATTGTNTLTSPQNLIFITRLGLTAAGSTGNFIICNSDIRKNRTITLATTGRPSIIEGTC